MAAGVFVIVGTGVASSPIGDVVKAVNPAGGKVVDVFRLKPKAASSKSKAPSQSAAPAPAPAPAVKRRDPNVTDYKGKPHLRTVTLANGRTVQQAVIE
jgi:hypothetical protein